LKNTGEPGGRKVGQKVTHYVVAGGPFERACGELLAGGIRVEWQSVEGESEAARRSRLSMTRYTCPGCGLNAWAKPGVHLVCGRCWERMEAEGGGS
jgi:hypothetical protein